MPDPDPVQQLDTKEIAVFVPDPLRSGVYAHITSINATESEVTLNFVQVNHADSPQGTLVGRVVISREHASKLLDSLKGVLSTVNEVHPR